MNILENLTINQVFPPRIVHSQEGKTVEITNRQEFGLSFCYEGQITYNMGGKKYIENHNNVVILPKGGSYAFSVNKNGRFPLINFECENLCLDEILVLPIQNFQACISLYETISTHFLYKSSRLIIHSAFYELLHEISSQSMFRSNRLKSVIRYIELNISDPELSNLTLANQINISEIYLRELFHTHYNTTPKQFILDLRIRKAKQMLINTPFTITAIAKDCGFTNVYHFCRIFKKKTGQTPTEYANKKKTYQI